MIVEHDDLKHSLARTSERELKDYQFRRIRHPYRAPLLFDCRFNGAAEQIVQLQYQDFLTKFMDISISLKENHRLNCSLADISPSVLSILYEAQANNFDPVKMCVRLKYHRVEIARKVAEEIKRDTSGDAIRRMGIGDQLVLIGMLQAIDRDLGQDSVTVVYDPIYPCSATVMGLSGLHAIPLPPDMDIREAALPESTIVDMRRHLLEHPLAEGVPCYYGEAEGSPLDQALWNLGWEHIIPNHRAGELTLHIPPSAREKATSIFPAQMGYITCQPLELTRLNKDITPGIYSAVIQSQDVQNILFGCGPNEERKLHMFIQQMSLPPEYKAHVICQPLPVWIDFIARAKHHYAGNSSGMWFGFATNTPLTILSKADRNHGTMWDLKSSWFKGKRWNTIRVIR